MTSIEDLFKKPGLPNNKRKAEPLRNPEEVYKAAKLSTNGDAKSRPDTSREVEGQEADGVAGPELPPDEPEDIVDEEGRFFGGGVSKDTADVLDFIDERDTTDAEPEKIDLAWLRRLALNFERRISKNAELRAKFEDDPQKFMGSEADLDADVKALSILTDYPELYGEFAKLGCVNSLVSLLAHENTDIAIDAIEILSEMTDEDVQAEQSQWDYLVDAMLESDLPNLLVQNLTRLDETNESDRSGVYHSLNLVENLASNPKVADKVVQDSSLLQWLHARIKVKESPITQNKQYAAEVLAILLQSSPKVIQTVTELEGVDTLLQLLSRYRKIDPVKDSEEEEFVENLFDCLTCLVDETRGKTKFLEAEGVELCLIMLREGRFSKPRALRLLDHAMGGIPMYEVCERFVEAIGLKTVFGMFMKQMDSQSTEHVLGIFSSLLAQLPGDSPPRIRTLAKFIEKNYEKVTRLMDLRRAFGEKLLAIDNQIKVERSVLSSDEKEARADEYQSRRLDEGLYSYQTINVILAWLSAEDAGAGKRITMLLHSRGESMVNIKATLQEQLASLEGAEHGAGISTSDMLRTLVEVL